MLLTVSANTTSLSEVKPLTTAHGSTYHVGCRFMPNGLRLPTVFETLPLPSSTLRCHGAQSPAACALPDHVYNKAWHFFESPFRTTAKRCRIQFQNRTRTQSRTGLWVAASICMYICSWTFRVLLPVSVNMDVYIAPRGSQPCSTCL
ncbi:uncharacterized protein MYCFIDRAFT_211137 [Pseudocercospora fijiensis CIRAD86]|uniref:Uncharacterized protein n=1 Tax=Pseudocercospora fijiensis (strain CIRAD86) TaxID=383855 RepID=M3AZZ0_PSEFD|nr:uncharacterized protein MYCFIDRAFT_211137 [Pseudocercospora fijiensis CIRAD86]EME82737.1 hypothetical protein MYCFIDRAFT_211137 [Pseudocercospora fijiensis CIRAD86]